MRWILLLLLPLFIKPQVLPDLYVKSGDIKRLNPRKYKFNVVNIDAGAKLVFDGYNAQWAIIECDSLILRGIIEYKSFRRGLGIIKGNLNDQTFEYKFPEVSRGGWGSDGGAVFQGVQGGQGYKTLNANGGGGGSGAYDNKSRSGRITLDGNDAIDYRGATVPNYSNRKGGDGGKLDLNSNGGLIFIKANTIITGSSAIIDLSGKQGWNGYPGTKNFYDRYTQTGICGNGGGAAGGDGGVLIVHFSKINNYPTVLLNGGKRGTGGNNGLARKGEDGEDGIDGFVDWIQEEK